VLLLLAVVVSLSHAQRVANGPVLDNVAESYRTASRTWLTRILPVAQHTFALLATLELVISGTLWALRRDSMDDIAGRFLLKFVLMSFMLTLITAFDTWVPAIVGGFTTAGEVAGNVAGLSPSGILHTGWAVSSAMLKTVGTWKGLLNPVTSTFVAAMAFGIWLAFVLVAGQLLRVLVESYIVLTGGVLFLGFAGFRATAAYAENYLNYAVCVGIKIFLLYLIVGVGAQLTTTWAALLSADNWNIGAGDSSLPGEVFGGAVLFAILAMTIPGRIANRITGTHSFGVAHALRGL
jgi:type IV secretion system protein TrbL